MLGTTAWSLTMIKSGLVYSYGMGFWGPNGHDGIWHIALINSLSGFTLRNPLFAGTNIHNYHIGFDLLLAIIHRLTFIPVINLYFQVIPPIIALICGVLVYKFVYVWKKSRIQAITSTFFVYFSGSFGWIVTYARSKTFNGESLFWSQQAISTLINPPFALSLLIIFLGLIFLVNRDSNFSIKKIVLISILFGLLAQIKIYGGLLILAALFTGGVWEFVREKSNVLLLIFSISFAVSVFVILPTYNFSKPALIFQPFWFLESMVSNTDRFYWPKMASAIYNYRLSRNIIKEALAFALTLAIFLIGNLGIRIVSVTYFRNKLKSIKKLETTDVIIFTIVLLGLMVPMLFIQSGNSWNSIQFFYYSLIFLSVISGVVVGEFLEAKIKKSSKLFKYVQLKKNIVITLIILFCIPTNIATLRNYLPSRPPSKIPTEELKALNFLKRQPEGVVLTIPFSREYANEINPPPPKPLYLYESTAYVSALSEKVTYLEDQVNLDITGYPWEQRPNEIIANFGNISYLRSVGINYIYIPDVSNFAYKDEMEPFSIYNKDNVAIYKL